jgi:iron complex transport system substrate-binding protein
VRYFFSGRGKGCVLYAFLVKGERDERFVKENSSVAFGLRRGMFFSPFFGGERCAFFFLRENTRDGGKDMRKWILLGLLMVVYGYGLRIVTLGPRLTEQVFELGHGQDIVGNTIYCTRPSAAQKIQKVGNVIEINVEAIASLKPDLILGTDLNDPKRIERLRQLGFKVVIFTQPANFEGICREYVEIGRLLGKEKEATHRVEVLKKEVEKIAIQTAKGPRRRVFFQIGINPLWTLPDQSFMQDYLKYANAINVATNVGYGQISLEQVVASDPEVILIALMDSEAKEAMAVWKNYPSLSAVKRGHVHLIDTTMATSPTPATFVAILKQIVSMTR